MPVMLENSKYLGEQIYRGRNTEKEDLSKILIGFGGWSGKNEKVFPLGDLLSSQGKSVVYAKDGIDQGLLQLPCT